MKVVKRWLCPLDPTFSTFYSVDAEDRFWQEKKGEYSPAEAPPELVERHEKWKRARTHA